MNQTSIWIGMLSYIMPMANKDGVPMAYTLTVGGVNLNRNWDKPANPKYSPEDACIQA